MMRPRFRPVLTAALAVGFACSLPRCAVAQLPSTFTGPGRLTLMANTPAVQEALQLQDEVRERLSALHTQYMEHAKALEGCCSGKGPKPGDPESEQAVERFWKSVGELDMQVKTILSESEVRRVNEITWQIAGAAALLDDPELRRFVGIDGATEKKLRAVRERYQQEVQASAPQRLPELYRNSEKEMLGALSAKQREKYREAVGEPLSDSFELGHRFQPTPAQEPRRN